MRTRWIFCLLILPLALQLGAQESRTPEWVVKLSPLSLIDPLLPSANLALEWRTGGSAAIHIEGGWLYNYNNRGDSYYNARGFRFRPAVRFYGFSGTRNAYTEIMFISRFAKMDVETDFLITATSGASYYQRLSYRLRSQKFGLFANLGGRSFIGAGYFIEYAVGGGVSFRYQNENGVPENAQVDWAGWFSPWDPSRLDERWLPEITFYLNFGKAVTYLPED